MKGRFIPQSPTAMGFSASKYPIKKPKFSQRNLGLGDQEASSIHMANQLKTEIQELDKRINVLQQDNQPNLDMVQHLGAILQSRQSVLNWLQLRDSA